MVRTILFVAMSLAALAVHAQELVLPFEGRWFVAQGGDTPNVNHHMAVRAQWYGVDFAKAGGPNGRALTSAEKPSRLADFYSWNQRVLAPVEGEVTSVVNDLPDNALGGKDVERPAGNHIAIRTSAGTYVFLAHLKRGSVVVEVGDWLKKRQIVGRVGNSGNSDFPHLHVHMQNTPILHQGEGRNLFFSGMDVELTGKLFEAVTWPLIRGLFVQAR